MQAAVVKRWPVLYIQVAVVKRWPVYAGGCCKEVACICRWLL